MKELVPTVFSNDSGTYLRLEFFIDGKLVDRITVKVDKIDEENILKFCSKHYA